MKGWVQVRNDIDGKATDDLSGQSISLSFDGTIVAIGAIYNDNENGVNSGHTRIYQFSDSITPLIIGPSGSAGDVTSTKSINENIETAWWDDHRINFYDAVSGEVVFPTASVIHTFSANETVTWSISGGADSSNFKINSSSGALSFYDSRFYKTGSFIDFESPRDSDLNNSYIIDVRATDAV